MPGMIDTHVHIYELGCTEWEGFESGSRALAAEGKNYIEHTFYGGWFREIYNVQELSDAGVVAYKCFMATCGSDLPGDFKNVDVYTLYEGLKRLVKLGHVLSIHAENAEIWNGKKALSKAKREILQSVENNQLFKIY